MCTNLGGNKVTNKKARQPKKRRGRPPLPATARKGVNLTFRARQDMRQWLGAEAEKSGRSMSEQIEHILEAHRSNQDVVLRALGGEQASEIITPVLLFLSQLDQHGLAWNNEPKLTEKVKEATQIIVDAALTQRVIPLEEYGSLFDKSDDARDRIARIADGAEWIS